MNDKFVKESLLSGETIIATAKFHPIKVWFLPLLFFVAGVVMICISLHIFPYYGETFYDYLMGLFNNDTYGTIGVCAIILSVVFCVIGWSCKYDEFAITNKRIVVKVGVIRRVAFELQSEQVESIEIHQGILGRILNYGTLMPRGIGASKVRIPFVVNPFEFRQHFYELKNPQTN